MENNSKMVTRKIPQLTLGSLFDGSGGFPLGGAMCGIKTIWTSEISPFPLLVEHKNFPNAKHYGDINGHSVHLVKICQSLENDLVLCLKEGVPTSFFRLFEL